MRSVVSVSIDDELRARLNAYQEEHGAKNFSAAVREVLELGFQVVDGEAVERALASQGNRMDGELADERAPRGERPPAPAEQPDVDAMREHHAYTHDPPHERVYGALTTKRRTIMAVAAEAEVSEDETLSILERLIDQDGEPIVISRDRGEWVCWIEAERL